jgi:hypothetical protein
MSNDGTDNKVLDAKGLWEQAGAEEGEGVGADNAPE